jgi:site-specific DNA recombinase
MAPTLRIITSRYSDPNVETLGLTVPECPTAALPVAVGYVRRSRESDARTVSLAAQRSAIERYATEHGWQLAAVLEHDGVSGGKRSRFAHLDTAVKENGARVVICYHLDRLARDAAALLDWCAGAAKRGVELHIVGRGKTETSSSAGYLGVGVEALVAAHFRMVVGEKTKDALRHLRESGRRWTRTAPFGWTWEDGRCVTDPVEQASIKRAQALRSSGLSLRQVSAELAAAGMLGRAGRPLSAETVNSIVRANVGRVWL